MAAGDGDLLARARELRLAGLADNSAGRPTLAARTLRLALRLLDAGDPRDRDVIAVRVACLLTLAISELATSGLAAALARLDEARVLAGDDPELVARWRCQRGNVLGRAGDYAEAVTELEVVVTEPHWFTPLERCATLLNRGMVNFELGRPGSAARDFEAATDLAKEAGDERYRFMAEHNRGYALYLTGDLPGALATMAAAEEMPADVFRGPSLFDLGRVLGEAGLLDEAVAALDRAQAACRPRQDRILRAEIDLERARILRLTGEFDDAAAAARAALTRFRRLGAIGPAARAELTLLDCDLSRRRRLEQVLAGALSTEQVALQVGDAELRARSIVVASEGAARLGRPEVARTALRRYPSDSFGLVLHLRQVYAAAVTDLAAGRSPRPRLAAAAAELGASQAVSASLDSRAARKVLGLRLAELDVDLAVRQGPTATLDALERWTTRGLPVVRPPADPRQAELTERLRSLSRLLHDDPPPERAAAWQSEHARLRRELTELGLAQRQEQLVSAPLPDLTEALAKLGPADRDLLWFFAHDRALWGIGLVKGRRRLMRLAELADCLEITRRIGADLRASAHHTDGPLREAVSASLESGLRWVDDHLIRPWRRRSAGLVVIGSHAVIAMPWGLVPSLQGVPVTVARSVTEWAGRTVVTPRPQVRVLTGPGLQYAAAEGAGVAAAWRAAPGHNATAAELVSALATAELVHIAAHGRHRADSPLFSSLRMADGDAYAHELPAGRIRSGHVVLSACDVGNAQFRPGDEPLGLASTLLALGVSSVVASVAPVADETTAALMADYHAGLARGLSSDEALAAAGPGSPFVVLGSAWRASTEGLP